MPLLTQRQKSWGNIKPPVWGRLNRASPVAPKSVCLLFNEGAGTSLYNRSNVQGNGTLSGAYEWTPGRGGKAVRLNRLASTGKVSLSGISFGTTCWFSLWMSPATGSGSYAQLFGDAAATAGLYFRGATNKLDMVFTPGGDHLNNTALTLGTWNHIVISINGGSGTFYLNGKPDGTFSSWPGTTLQRIGTDNFSEFFAGSIESVMGTSGEYLTAAEVWRLYTDRYVMFLPPPPARLVKTAPVVFVGPTSGGWTLGGTAGPTITFSPPTAGGVTLGGTSAPAVTFLPPTAGGIVLGGSSAPSTTFTPPTGGGITLGGSNSLQPTFTVSTSGGLTLGGSSTGNLAFTVTTSGGMSFGGSSAPTYVQPTDLVSALQMFYAGTPELSAITAGFFVDVTPPGQQAPWIKLESISETLPGYSIEDEPEDASFCVTTTDLAYTKQLGALIKKHVSSGPERTQPPRDSLQWFDPVSGLAGYERYNLQFASKPRRKAGLGPGGMPLWEYVVMFRFVCDRTGALP